MSPMACGAMLLICETRRVDLEGTYVSKKPNLLSTIALGFRTASDIQLMNTYSALPNGFSSSSCSTSTLSPLMDLRKSIGSRHK